MILRARQDGNVLIFDLEGHLDFETTLQFRTQCQELMKTRNIARIVFNLEKLKFVGSSGINQFIKIMKEFNSKNKEKPKFCFLSSEFEKLFKVYQPSRNPFEIYDNIPGAVASFDFPRPKPLKRKKVVNN